MYRRYRFMLILADQHSPTQVFERLVQARIGEADDVAAACQVGYHVAGLPPFETAQRVANGGKFIGMRASEHVGSRAAHDRAIAVNDVSLPPVADRILLKHCESG